MERDGTHSTPMHNSFLSFIARDDSTVVRIAFQCVPVRAGFKVDGKRGNASISKTRHSLLRHLGESILAVHCLTMQNKCDIQKTCRKLAIEISIFLKLGLK